MKKAGTLALVTAIVTALLALFPAVCAFGQGTAFYDYDYFKNDSFLRDELQVTCPVKYQLLGKGSAKTPYVCVWSLRRQAQQMLKGQVGDPIYRCLDGKTAFECSEFLRTKKPAIQGKGCVYVLVPGKLSEIAPTTTELVCQ